MDEVFAVEGVVLIERYVCQAVSTDSERLRLAVQEENLRFIHSFRWGHIPLPRSVMSENEPSRHEPIAAGPLRPISNQTHQAESFVAGTTDGVPLSSSTL